MGQVPDLFTSDFSERDQIMGIQRKISRVGLLMKQILRNQDHADIFFYLCLS